MSDNETNSPISVTSSPKEHKKNTSSVGSIAVTLSSVINQLPTNVLRKLDFEHDENAVDSVVERLLGDDIELDIYEITGLYARASERLDEIKPSGEDNKKDDKNKIPDSLSGIKRAYWYAVWQCLVCASAQIMGVCLILKEVIKNIDGKFCRKGGSIHMKLLSTLLQMYLFQFTLALFNSNQGKSLQHIKSSLCLGTCVDKKWNQHNKKVPHTLYNPYWVTFGVHVNNLTFVIVSITSAFLIYATDSAIELILNGVALFFISEMDNFLVGSNDKKRVRDGLRWYKSTNYDWSIKKEEKQLVVNKVFDVFNGGYLDFYNIFSLPLTFVLMFVVPVWNVVCY